MLLHNNVEHFHDAQYALSEARARFTQDKLSITELAKAENEYALLCQQIKSQLNPNTQSEAVILELCKEEFVLSKSERKQIGFIQ